MLVDDELFWRDLLLAIERPPGVVPILGRDLMVVETESGPRHFHDLVAERIANDLNLKKTSVPIECPRCGHELREHLQQVHDLDCRDGHDAMNHVFCQAEILDRNPENFGEKYVLPVVEELSAQYKVPSALRKLLQIPAFDLLVTTTFDTLLERAVVEEGLPLTTFSRAPTYPPAAELAEVRKTRAGDRLFLLYLFGRAVRDETYAFSDAQYLDLMHDFIWTQNPGTSPVDLLAGRHLLLIGVTFPDWLSRFLIKAARPKERLWAKKYEEFIVNSTPPSKGLETFLSLFMNGKSRMLKAPMSSVDFAAELHDRWFANPRRTRRSAPPPTAAKSAVAKKVRVFLSYSHEDEDPGHAARVEQLARRLQDTGVIETVLDMSRAIVPDEGWYDWSREKARDSDKVLMIGSKTYYSVEEGNAPGTKGKGVAAELRIIKRWIDEDHGKSTRARLIVLRKEDEEGMSEATWRVRLHGSGDPKTFKGLVAWLTEPRTEGNAPSGPKK